MLRSTFADEVKSIGYREETRVKDCLRRIRLCFETHFDQSWLVGVMDELPIRPNTLIEIRIMLEYL